MRSAHIRENRGSNPFPANSILNYMQTFLPYKDPIESVKALDDKRLGKQRVEAIQIARCLLGHTDGWKNHPAVKMWKGYEPYLVKVYLKATIDEWGSRGYKNIKCNEHYEQLNKQLGDAKVSKPDWVNDDFCEAHRSMLVRKKPEYYGQKFAGTRLNLEYIWPVKESK